MLSAIFRTIRATLPSHPCWAVLTSVGFLAEAIGIAWGEPNLYATDLGTILFGLLFLAWFWLTVGWGLQGLGQIWRWRRDQARGWEVGLLWFGIGLIGACLVGGYAVSWGLFYRTGRFANLETGRFVLVNVRQLWPYLVEAEWGHFVVGVPLILAALVGLPALLSWGAGRATTVKSERQRRYPFVAWMSLALLAVLSWQNLPAHHSTLRQAARLHVLQNGLNPTFSLYVSQRESSLAAPIRPTLDPLHLRPLRDGVHYLADLPPAATTQPSVIFVAIESLRHDVIHQRHQGRELLPNINRLARQGLQLTRAYAESTHSDYADVCLVSSLYPLRSRRHHYYAASDPWPVTRIYDLLQPRGYATAIISSQNEAWGGMDHFLTSDQLQWFYHPETSRARTWVSSMDRGFSAEIAAGGLVAGKFADGHTTDQAIEWIENQVRAGRPFFLSMNFQSSHFPYLMPDDVPRPFAPHQLSPDISFVEYPQDQVERVRNAYCNAIHECDRQVGRLVEALRTLGQLDNTILVVTGENGEAFHEAGQVSHASEPVEPAIHVACVLHSPNILEHRVEDYPFEHVDLVPTVLGLMGWPAHPNFQGIDILAADRPPAEDRLNYCHVLSSLAQTDAVIRGGRWKLTVNRRTGASSLHDVVSDPLQEHDLLMAKPELAEQLQRLLEQWREQQLAYYHFPGYYLNYFPPAPPRTQIHNGTL